MRNSGQEWTFHVAGAPSKTHGLHRISQSSSSQQAKDLKNRIRLQVHLGSLRERIHTPTLPCFNAHMLRQYFSAFPYKALRTFKIYSPPTVLRFRRNLIH